MNTFRTLSSVVAAVGLLSLCSADPAFAFGGGASGAGPGGSGASSGGGGGHGGGSSSGATGAGHGGFSGGSGAGLSGRGASFRSMAATYNGAPHYLPGGYAPNAFGRSSSSGRAASRVAVNRPVVATQDNAYAQTAQTRASAALRPGNAWTDSGATGVRSADRQAYPDAANRSDNAYRLYIANGNYNGLTTPNGIAGSYLYPGAYGSALNAYYNGQTPRGALANNGPARSFAQYQNWYGPNAGYHPHWPNGYYPYFGTFGYPFFGSDFGLYSGYYGGDTNLTGDNSPANNDQSVATVDSGPAPADQPGAQPRANGQNPPDSAQPPPANPDSRASSGALSNGPDSLIEAVQAELARRGYFSGKVDAMYGPSTREALRRFQTDAGLAATGRINEATMHALQLD